MTYYSTVIDGEIKTMWFWRKKTVSREKAFQKKEAQIQAIDRDTLKTIDKASKKIMEASKKTEKLNNFIEKEDGGVTELIFLATGGDRRSNR